MVEVKDARANEFSEIRKSELKDVTAYIILQVQPSALKNIHSFFSKIPEVSDNLEELELEVGKSGYIYIDGEIDLPLKNMYTPSDVENCVSLCKEIQGKLKSIREDGGYEYKNKEDKWNGDTKNDHRYHDKYTVLAATMKYLLGEIDQNKLSEIVSQSKDYDKKFMGTAATRDLLDKALNLRAQSLNAKTLDI